jgi:hypothetical protein
MIPFWVLLQKLRDLTQPKNTSSSRLLDGDRPLIESKEQPLGRGSLIGSTDSTSYLYLLFTLFALI